MGTATDEKAIEKLFECSDYTFFRWGHVHRCIAGGFRHNYQDVNHKQSRKKAKGMGFSPSTARGSLQVIETSTQRNSDLASAESASGII